MKSAWTVCFLIAAMGFPFAVGAPAYAGAEIKLSGTAKLDDDYCAKGTSNPDCVIDFSITGKAAKVIYDGMPEKGEMQECTGNVEKFNEGGMHCIKGKTAAGYYCDFSYAFKDHKFGAGPDGC